MLALVTGGLSKLGVVVTRRLAAAGYDVALHGRAAATPPGDLVAAIDAAGRRWAMFDADLDDSTALEQIVPRVLDSFGTPPNLLVNSASMLSEGGWDDIDVDALVAHFRVNTAAPLVLTRALAAAVGPDARAAVINILDQRIINPGPDQAAYTTSKLALAAATRALARGFAPRLRVNAVAPGLTIPGPEYAADQIGRLAEMMPLGLLPAADDVADAILYLAQASSVTGQILFVDGGASLESYPRDFVHMAR